MSDSLTGTTIDRRERRSAGNHHGVAGMKKGWETKTLGEVLQKTETVNPLQTPNTEFDYIDVSSVSNATFQIEATQRLKGKDAPSRARKLVKTNDILFATIRPTLQRIAVVPDHLDQQVCSTGYFVLRVKPGIDHRFIFHFLFTEIFAKQMESLQKGASYPAVTDGDVRAQVISVPPLPEQQRIVGVVDEAFAGLATAHANAEKNLQNARALFESHLQSVFTQCGNGWVEKTLGDLCETTQGVQIPKNLHYKTGGVNLRRYLYISDFDHDENLKFVEDIYPKKRVTEDDLIVANTGATAGKIFRGIDGVLSNNLFKVTINHAFVDGDFLYHFVTSCLFKEHQKKIVKGTANPHMGHENFKSTPISIPTLKMQLEEVGNLDALETETKRLENLYQQKLSALLALKKSLLHQAFSGEL